MSQSRREFLSIVAVLGGGALAGCGGGGGPHDSGGGGMCNDVSETIAGNHGHVLVVPPADVTAGVQRVYDNIRGTATHNHTVTVTAAMFARLASGQNATVTTSDPDQGAVHHHMITLVCV